MTPIAWVVEHSIQASERFRNLTVFPEMCGYCGGSGDVHSLDGEWRSFHEVSESDFWLCMNEMGKKGTITFEPKERKVDE